MPRKKKLAQYISQRKDGRYAATFPVEGKSGRKILYGKTPEEAEAAMESYKEAWEEARNEVEAKAARPITTKEAADEWCFDPDLSYNTNRKRRWLLDLYILPRIGEIPFEAVQPEDISAIYKALREKGLGASSLVLVRSVLSSLFRTYYKARKIPSNPMDFVLKHPSPKRHKPNPLSVTEVNKLLSNNTSYTPLWTTMVYTGIRTSEAIGLKWENIKFEENTIEIRQQIIHKTSEDFVFAPLKTWSSERDIKMNSTLRNTLLAHRQAQLERRMEAPIWEDWGIVFPNEWANNGRPIHKNNMSKYLQNELKKLGIERRSPRHLRHTFASMNAAAGVSAKVTQEKMGHSSIKTTLDVYSATTPTMHEDAADSLENFIQQTA